MIDADSHRIVWSHDVPRRGWLRWLKDGSGLIVNDPTDSGDIWI